MSEWARERMSEKTCNFESSFTRKPATPKAYNLFPFYLPKMCQKNKALIFNVLQYKYVYHFVRKQTTRQTFADKLICLPTAF